MLGFTTTQLTLASIKKSSGRLDFRGKTRLAGEILFRTVITDSDDESDSAPSSVVASESEAVVKVAEVRLLIHGGDGKPPSANSASPAMRTEMGL